MKLIIMEKHTHTHTCVERNKREKRKINKRVRRNRKNVDCQPASAGNQQLCMHCNETTKKWNYCNKGQMYIIPFSIDWITKKKKTHTHTRTALLKCIISSFHFSLNAMRTKYIHLRLYTAYGRRTDRHIRQNALVFSYTTRSHSHMRDYIFVFIILIRYI